MNRRLLTILLCAFFAAAAASYVVYRLVGKEVGARVRGKTHTVIVAAHDLEIGVLIKKDDLTTGEIVGEPPKGAVLKAETAVGRGVISKLYQGEAILENRLAATGSGGGLAAIIPPGMRACAVKVNDVVGVAGFVLPGMRVDVLVSGSPAGVYNTANARVKTLLQNIEVLSAGTNFQRDNEGKPVQVQVVNLLVTPEQAELLSLASNETKIQLVLRNPLDRKMAQPPGAEMARLLGAPAPPPARPSVARTPSAPVAPPTPPPVQKTAAPAPKPAVYTIQILNGSKRSNETFPDTGAHQ